MVRHKFYNDFQSLLVPIYYYKNQFMDFITILLLSIDEEEDKYDPIFVIINQLIKMVHYQLVKIVIDRADLAELIIKVIIKHHGFHASIISH